MIIERRHASHGTHPKIHPAHPSVGARWRDRGVLEPRGWKPCVQYRGSAMPEQKTVQAVSHKLLLGLQMPRIRLRPIVTGTKRYIVFTFWARDAEGNDVTEEISTVALQDSNMAITTTGEGKQVGYVVSLAQSKNYPAVGTTPARSVQATQTNTGTFFFNAGWATMKVSASVPPTTASFGEHGTALTHGMVQHAVLNPFSAGGSPDLPKSYFGRSAADPHGFPNIAWSGELLNLINRNPQR